MSLKILYCQPKESFGDTRFLTSFLRISNYLNSKKAQINGEIEEEYLDLRFEDLPLYCPEYLSEFREKLETLLLEIYNRFKFDVLAITCFTSFTYLNCIETSWMVKHKINPNCQIIVGGVHPTTYPEDFYAKSIPQYFEDFYPESSTPFDAICIDEGEKVFFHFIKDLFYGKWIKRIDLHQNPIILKTELMVDLNKVPLIDLNLFKKYKETLNKKGEFYLNWSRGCIFRCLFCSSSLDSKMESYRRVRSKSVQKCIDELKIILNTKWLKLQKLMIDDAVFFPKRTQRDDFFKEFDYIYQEFDIPFQLFIHDRMEICTMQDLDEYKKYKMIPGFGLETGSPKLLCRLGKFLGRNNTFANAAQYLKLAEKFIIKANKIDTPIVFLCMGATPGEIKDTMKESQEFFLAKRFAGKSLIEKYKVNLQIQKFGLLPSNTFYEKGEELFGAEYYFKKWYKIFDKEQALYSAIFKPSEDISFLEAMNFLSTFLGILYKAQLRLRNHFYTFPEYIYHQKLYKRMVEIFHQKVKVEERDHPYSGSVYVALLSIIYLFSLVIDSFLFLKSF